MFKKNPPTDTRHKVEGNVSLEKALKALTSLGLSEVDAKVYIYLAKKGPHEQEDLANALKLTKHQLCLSIEKLLLKRMVKTTTEQSIKYSAIELEKVLDQFVQSGKKQVKTLQMSSNELLFAWHELIENANGKEQK